MPPLAEPFSYSLQFSPSFRNLGKKLVSHMSFDFTTIQDWWSWAYALCIRARVRTYFCKVMMAPNPAYLHELLEQCFVYHASKIGSQSHQRLKQGTCEN